MSDFVWAMPAAGMVPSHQTLRQRKFMVKGGAVFFAPGETGQIILTGAVTTEFPKDE